MRGSEPPRLRIGILGAGRRGAEHLRSIVALPDLYELVAVCDVSAGAAARAAALAAARPYGDVREFLARENLDLVVITTPRETHHVMVKIVAEHHVNMLVETPLATTRAMMDVIQETADTSNLKIEVAENMWRRPAERLNRQAIADGRIGDVVRVTSHYGPAGGNSCYHTMSLMRSYAGADVEEVLGLTQRQGSGPSDEIWTHGHLKYRNGVVGTVTYTSNWVGPLRRGHPRFFSVEGTSGFIITGDCPGHMLRQVEDGVAHDYPKRIETRKDDDREDLICLSYETDPPLEFLNPFVGRAADDGDPRKLYDELARAAELESIHRAITTGGEPDYGVAQARRDMELSILIAESARLGKAIPATAEAVGSETEWEREQHQEFRDRYSVDPIRDLDAMVKHPESLRSVTGRGQE